MPQDITLNRATAPDGRFLPWLLGNAWGESRWVPETGQWSIHYIKNEMILTEDLINQKYAEFTTELPMLKLREVRDVLLRDSDWASGEDVPQAVKDAWFPYRQALRDITNTYSSLDDVVWPTRPE